MATTNKFLDLQGLTYYHGKIKTLLAEKVDKVEGKGLSTNDYTDVDKAKLDAVQAEATKTTVTTVQKSGTKIATITVNGTDNDVYAPAVSASATKTSGTKVATVSVDGSDTDIYVPTVSASATSTTGTKLGSVSVDGTATDIYAPAVTQSAPGFMSGADKAKLDAFTSAEDYALKSDITNMYKYKGSVANEAALPATGNTAGDVYNTEDTGMNYAWTGTAWDTLGEVFSLTSISTGEIDTLFSA